MWWGQTWGPAWCGHMQQPIHFRLCVILHRRAVVAEEQQLCAVFTYAAPEHMEALDPGGHAALLHSKQRAMGISSTTQARIPHEPPEFCGHAHCLTQPCCAAVLLRG